MTFEQFPQLMARSRRCDAIGIPLIVIVPFRTRRQLPTVGEDEGQGIDILEMFAGGETDFLKERFPVELVPGVAVAIGFAMEPVTAHVGIGLVGKGEGPGSVGGTNTFVDTVFDKVELLVVHLLQEIVIEEGIVAEGIVTVNECQHIPGCHIDTAVAGNAEALVRLVIDTQPLVFLPQLFREFLAAVGRAVVDEDNLHVDVLLSQDGLYAVAERLPGIVNGYDDR